ncbi:MAG: hypothetical protein K6G61_03010 [Solobacterium sp.]|nr:hypothetical protein [Solobacterium sp.]
MTAGAVIDASFSAAPDGYTDIIFLPFCQLAGRTDLKKIIRADRTINPAISDSMIHYCLLRSGSLFPGLRRLDQSEIIAQE